MHLEQNTVARNQLLSWTSHSSCSSHMAVVYSIRFGVRTISVLYVFVLPQSKALTQILSWICFAVLLRWRKTLTSELSSSHLMKPPALWEALFRWVTKSWINGKSLSAVWGKDSNKLVPCIPPPAPLVLASFLGILCHYSLSFLLTLSLLMLMMGHVQSVLSLPGDLVV